MPTLTHKQKIILQLIARGMLSKQVADRLNMKEEGVWQVLRRLRLKFQCVNTTHLIALMVEKKEISVYETIHSS